MTATVHTTEKPQAQQPDLNVDRSGLLQRQCDCGKTAGLTGACGECQSLQLKALPSRMAQPAASAPVLHEMIQAKLTIGAPNDRYEQEADRMADRVMRMPDTEMPQPVEAEEKKEEEEQIQTKPWVQLLRQGTAATITLRIQREVMLEENKQEEEETIQAKSIDTLILRQELPEEEEEPVQAKSVVQRSAVGDLAVDQSIESRLHSTKGQGNPLPEDVRSFMEPRFGADFSQVRVHTDSQAVQMNQDLNAHAFTHQQDIYFGAGKAPAKDALTAHELTHTIQQNTLQQMQSGIVQGSWIGDRITWVRTAIQNKNWGNADPPGAYYVLNGLSMEDMVKLLRGLTKAERAILSDNLEDASGFDRPRIQLALTNAAMSAGSTWWRELSEKVHWAIRSNKFVEYPDGAFWIINPLNAQDTIKIMTFLSRQSLDLLIQNSRQAIEVGVPNAGRILDAANKARGNPSKQLNVKMFGFYDDYKSNPEYVDNFSSAAYDPLSKTLHLFFDDGGEAILILPLQNEGVVLFFEWKSLLTSPGTKDLKIYPSIKTKNLLPNVGQWLADHAEEMQQTDLLLSAGLRTLEARSVPPNLWWLALVAPAAGLSARFLSSRMRPAFKTIEPEPGEIPIIKAPKGGSPSNTTPESPTKPATGYAGSKGELAESRCQSIAT
jgi:Domain of unknown function (DUF4157)